MKDEATTPTGGRRRRSRVERWLQPRRLATVAASSLALAGGLFGVLSHTLTATAVTYTVDTTADLTLATPGSTTCNPAGTCSLRAAITASNNAGGSNTITVPAGTYNLSLGELQVGPNGGMTVTISGAGAASTIIHASQPVTCTSSATSTCARVFNVDPAVKGSVNFTVSGVTISGGRTAQFGGAGILNGTGAAITPVDSTTVTNSIITDNVIYSAVTSVEGGGVAQTYGSVTVSGSTFSNNNAGAGAGGGIFLSLGSSTLSVSNSTFSGNTAAAGGGAFFLGGSGSGTVTGSTFSSNTSTTNGGAIDFGGTTTGSIGTTSFSSNSGGRGGAVKITGGSTSLTDDTFTGNTSTGDGGALAVETSATVTHSTFTGNQATSGGHGGAIFDDSNGTLTMQYSRLYNNTATTANQAYLTGGGSGSVSAPNNWWGVNAGPGSAISGFSVSVWQILTSTASPSTILVHQTSTITADLDHTNTSTTIAPAHHLPDGIPVAFANGTLGTVSSTSGSLSSGATSTTYTAGGTGGVDGVPTTIDGQTVNAAITVDQPPHITSANNATFVVGTPGTFHVTAAGYPAPTFSETGALPSGVTLTSGGLLSGTAATATGGVYAITITATNGVTPDDTQSFTLTVNEAPFITSADNRTFTVGSPGTFTITSRGYPAPSITLTSGSLPGGVTYDAPTHVLSGTPNAGTGGQYALQFTSHNGIGSDSVQAFTLTVNEPASISSANNTTFTVGTPGTFAVQTGGFPHPSLSDGGVTLPTGVTFHDNADGTATLSGTPGAGTGGTYPFTITAHNGIGTDATQGFTLTVNEAASVTSAGSTTFTTGSPGAFTVTTFGFPRPSLNDGGATLPSGVTFTDNGNGSATLSGTPGAGTGGTYPLTITAHNGIGTDGTQSFTLTVDQAPAITSANATTFAIGTPNTFSITTTGFPSGASMVITESGTLPTGVTFADNGNGTGTLAGNPGSTTAGSYPITFGANNGVAPAASQSFTLTVAGAPHITSANHTASVVGSAGTFTVTTTGSTPMTISETGSLPSGVTFTNNNDGTATLAGTPAAGTAGTYPLSITAHNSQTPDDVQSFTLQVNEAPAITSANHTTFTTGTAGTFTVTSTGTPTPALTESGALPSGVSFVDNTNGTGTLSGTPGAGTGGVYNISFKAANSLGQEATQPFTLTIDQAPAITSSATTTFTVGTAGSFNVTTTGFPHAAITEPDTMPTGLSFLDNNDGTATISGTPGTGTGGTYNIHLTANNGVSPNATQTLVLTVDEAAGITSADHTTFTVGTLGSFDVTTSGFPPAAVSETGTLPSGVTLLDNHNGTATLSGTPAAGTGGVYPITIRAHNGVGSDATQAFTLTVDEAPSITSANATTFTVGSPGTFTVTTGGYPPPTIAEGGALPNGVSFVDNGNGTGTLSGTPTQDQGGTYPITFTANNGVGSPAPQSFTLTVNEAPGITSANNTTFTVGSAGSFGVTTRGFPRPSLGESGALPSGVTFHDNGDGTATLSGTPATGSGGTYPITITAHNGVGSDASQPFTLTVNEASAFTSAASTTFTAGTAGSFGVTTRGFPHPAITETGTLPSGVSLHDNGDGTATLGGTPATGSGGVYHVSFNAHNGIGSEATQSFTLTVNEAAAVTSANTTTFTVGTAGSFGVTTRGYPTPSLGESGALPSGVTFADNHDGTATLSGTPATGTGGVYPITITAHNGVGSDGTQSFTLTVDEASAFTSANHTTFTTGQSTNFPITTRGYPAPVITESGALPGGVSFTDNGNGTATIGGTPNAGTGGTYPITLTAHNGIGSDATQPFTLTVDQPAAITSANSTTFTAGSANTFNVTTSGFPAPSLTETGTLPSGVSFTDNGNGTGTLSGTPATGTGGVYHVSFKAHNGVGSDATQSFTLTVNEAAAITSADHTQFQVGAPGTFTVTTRGYPIPSLGESGALPSGVSFTDNHDGTGTLAGTPATGTAGTYHVTFTAHNGVGSDGTQAFTLQVGPAPTTTTVTAGTTSPTFGSPDTFTATVAPQPPSSGTPAGTVTFAVDGTNTAVVTLAGGQAQWTTSSLQQGAHTISAAYSGQANTFQPSTGSIAVNTGCAVVYNTRIPGTLTITGGSACINGARISGGVSISGGASVSIVNSTIGNGITSSGAQLFTLCLSNVGGSLSVNNSSGFVLIGSNADDTAMPCAGNSIGGGVSLNGNTGGLEFGGNPSIKGAVAISNNVLAGGAVDAENGAPEIEHNSIKGSLSCNGNTPAPSNDGAPNTVSGARVGQCSAPGF